MHERVECSKMQRDTQVCDSTRVAQSSESSQHLRQFERHTSPRGSCSQLQSASARWSECQRTDLSLCYALRERCHTHTHVTQMFLSLSHSLSPSDRKSSAVPYEYLSPSRNLFPLALSPCCFQPFNQSMMEAALSPFDISNLTHLYHCKYTNTHTLLLPTLERNGHLCASQVSLLEWNPLAGNGSAISPSSSTASFLTSSPASLSCPLGAEIPQLLRDIVLQKKPSWSRLLESYFTETSLPLASWIISSPGGISWSRVGVLMKLTCAL